MGIAMFTMLKAIEKQGNYYNHPLENNMKKIGFSIFVSIISVAF